MRKLLLPVALLSACTIHDGQNDDDCCADSGGGYTGGGQPAPTRGTFAVTSELAITAEQLLPDPQEHLVQTLRDFSTDPGATLLDLADEAGVPAVGTLRSALPSVLEDKLVGYLDDEIANATIGGVPVTTFAGTIAGYAQIALTRFTVESTLSLDDLHHHIDAISISVAGTTYELPLSLLSTAATTDTFQLTTASYTSKIGIGDHEFGLAIGSYAWTALDAAVVDAYGADLRTLVGSAVNCPAVAQRIATKCVLGQCVGHASDLTELCERGLDEVVDQARAQVESFNFTALRLTNGTATLNGDKLEAGAWTAELDLGQGLRPTTGTFTGVATN